MESCIRQILLDDRIANLVGKDFDNNPKVYLLHAPDNTIAPYIEYEILDENGSLYAENVELAEIITLQIDIFTKGSYTKIKNAIKAVLKENGFNKEFGGSKYEDTTKLFHYVLRYNFENEEGM
ncbi:hypothetical protein SDC9_194454 [bioreactor metagenome]|uniref:DUF3168 domain-containing protein n=1 Tax=bioreactor metagenome TaxID=1076179 RepID=A0A645I6A8_9ZZZZ